ncbi:helix-turn-helix domain-containing protein [Leifsonia poae]|uniref:helix-turn-helix domain-containing protein n=1 Tax=Leifsonia poae TaxID=110933 RepID=UPI003D683364
MQAGDVVIIPSGHRHRIITGGPEASSGTRERQQSSYDLIVSDDREDEPPVIDLFCGHYRVGAGAGSILFGSLPTPTQASLYASGDGDGNGDGAATLARLSALMRAEADVDGAGSSAIMSALCTVLIALVLRTGTDAGGRARLWTAVADERMSRVVQEVLANPGEEWSVDRMSATALVSRATFFRRFQAATGMTFGRFLVRARLMHAAELLVDGDESVAQIASQVGYRSESAFTRAFRDDVGETPARFRRQQRRQPV